MRRTQVMNRLVIALCLVFTSLAIGANSASANFGDSLTVTYDSGGGSSITATSTTTGGSVADPGVPTLAGHTFAGWYTAASGGTRVTWPYTLGRTSNFSVYAQWIDPS